MIHPTAIVDRKAEIDSSVEIGPYCIIEGNVIIKKESKLLASIHQTFQIYLLKQNSFSLVYLIY